MLVDLQEWLNTNLPDPSVPKEKKIFWMQKIEEWQTVARENEIERCTS